MSSDIKIIEASGSPADLGHAIGTAVSASFKDAVIRNAEFKATQKHFAGSDYLKALNNAATQAYPRHMRELEAMNEASGTDTQTLMVQVQGKKRGELTIAKDASNADIETAALAMPAVALAAPQAVSTRGAIARAITPNRCGDRMCMGLTPLCGSGLVPSNNLSFVFFIINNLLIVFFDGFY